MTKLYKDKTGQYWSMAPAELAKPGCKPMHMQGGGFLHQIPIEVFAIDFIEVEGFTEGLSRGLFSVDGGQSFPGFCTPSKWNGWALPYFEKEAMLQAVQAFSTEDYPIRFDEATEQVICFMQGVEDEEPEVYVKEQIEFEGNTLDVWALGSGSWCWDVENV